MTRRFIIVAVLFVAFAAVCAGWSWDGIPAVTSIELLRPLA
jgi:hypothetical protein